MLNRGKFKKVGESVSVQTGDTLELRCRGSPVQWSVPPYLEEDDDGRLRWASRSINLYYAQFILLLRYNNRTIKSVISQSVLWLYPVWTLQDCPTRAIWCSDISQHDWRRHRGVHLLSYVLWGHRLQERVWQSCQSLRLLSRYNEQTLLMLTHALLRSDPAFISPSVW